MTEFITRFTPQQMWFIDGMTNQFSGYYDDDVRILSREQLFHIISYCMDKFSELQFTTEMNYRWKTHTNRNGIFQDLYDNLFDEDRDFFVNLSQHP